MFNPQPGCSSSTNFKSIDAFYQGELIAPVYLREIKTDNATIKFYRSISNELRYDNSIYSNWAYKNLYPFLHSIEQGYPKCMDNLKWHKLDMITIKNSHNASIKTINFLYNNVSTQRLMLTGITESGKNPYKFDYDNTASLPPFFLSSAQFSIIKNIN